MRKIPAVQLLILLMVGLLALSVQAQDERINPADYTGSISIAGSSTVAPVTQRMAEQFQQAGFRGEVLNEVIGTGGGFDRFCDEAITDIANASRPITEDELATCRANGREPVEFVIGLDALAITISSANGFVKNLTMEELAQVFSGRVATWQAVNAAYPPEPIFLFAPGTDSGTFDYFVEEVFDGDALPMLTTPGIAFSESDIVLVQNIEANPMATGFFGYAYYFAERSRLRALNIDGVEPNETSAQNGDYPLARPLFIYSAPSIMREKPQVAAFIRYYIENVDNHLGTATTQIGYFPTGDRIREENLAKWREATAQ